MLLGKGELRRKNENSKETKKTSTPPILSGTFTLKNSYRLWEMGRVAQGIRARGYEPRCRGFKSLLAHK